jgi:hypothetical protein
MIVKHYFYDMKKFSHKGAEAVEKCGMRDRIAAQNS